MKSPISVLEQRQGIFYRPRRTRTVYLFVKRDLRRAGGWKLRASQAVAMENDSPTMFVGIDRTFFANRRTTVDFDEGALTDINITKGSELVGFVSIPLYIAQGIVRGRAGNLPALGRGQATHPHHRPGQPAQAVASGALREVLHSRHDPGSQVLRRRAQGGEFQPFEPTDSVVICSYQFARAKAADVARTPWDLVVIDEAHRLRNVDMPANVIANTLKGALAERNKLLLTATPLRNWLLEPFDLVSFIDERSFGGLKSFCKQFAGVAQERAFDLLRERLKPICHRTLRRQVTAYVPYTKRHAILQEFSPDEAEDKLYNPSGDCCDPRWEGDGHYVVTDAHSPDTARRVTTMGSPLALNIEQNSIEPRQRSKGIKEGRVMLTQYKVHPMKSEVQRITSAPPDKKTRH